MRPLTRPGPFIALLVVAVAPLAACGGDDDGGGEAGGGSFAELLAEVPADALDGDAPVLQYVDMELVWERLGVADGTAEERLDALATTGQVDRFTLGPRLFEQMAMRTDEARQEVGFDVTDIEREIAVDMPPSVLRIVDVAVAPDVIDDATAADPVWSDRRQEVELDGSTYLDWTADGEELGQDLARRTPMRPLGVGGQLAVSERGDGSRVVRTNESSLTEAVLAAGSGDDGSAATDGVLAGVTEALDGDVVQAMALRAVSGMPVVLSPDDADLLESGEGFIEPYRAIVLADLLADGDTTTEVLLLHDSEDAAAANVAAVETWLEDGITLSSRRPVADVLGDAEVEQDGTIVRVSFAPGHFAAIHSGLLQQDLFVTR